MLALQGQAYQSPDKLKIKTLYHRLRCIPPSRSSSEVNLLVKVHAGIQGGYYHLRHAVTFKVHHHLPRWSLPCNGTYWFPGVFHLWHTPRSKALVILQDSYSLGTRAFQGPDHTFGTITRSREHMTYQGDTPSVLTAFPRCISSSELITPLAHTHTAFQDVHHFHDCIVGNHCVPRYITP